MKLLPPSIIEGMNGVWNKEREGGLTIKSDAAYADFIEVLVVVNHKKKNNRNRLTRQTDRKPPYF